MKRLLYFSLLVFIGMVCLQSPAAAQDGIRMYINGVEKFADPAPFIDTQSGRTYVPVRFVAESLGAEVSYVEAEKMVVVKSVSGKTICLFLNSTRATIDNAAVTLDAEAKVVNSRTMVPLRFVAENLDLVVAWDQNTQTITLTSQAAAPPSHDTTLSDPIVLPDGSSFRIKLLDGWTYSEEPLPEDVLVMLEHESGGIYSVNLMALPEPISKQEYLDAVREIVNSETSPVEEKDWGDGYCFIYIENFEGVDMVIADTLTFSDSDDILEGLIVEIVLGWPVDLPDETVDQILEDCEQLLVEP